MSRSIFAHNRFHLGDCLQSLHLLRALAKQNDQTPFVFFTHACNLSQLREVVADLQNIILADFESPLWREREHESEDMWKNHDHFWENSRFRWDWSQFMLSHHDWTAARLGFVSPFRVREALLLDYPALEKKVFDAFAWPADFLIVNSEPSSGQFKPMAEHGTGYLDEFVIRLRDKGFDVNYTKEISSNLLGDIGASRGVARWTGTKITDGKTGDVSWANLTDIGSMSRNCKHIIGIATGPLWPCVNVHNNHSHEGRKFIALLDNGENLNLPHWQQMSSREELMQFAKQEGWL